MPPERKLGSGQHGIVVDDSSGEVQNGWTPHGDLDAPAFVRLRYVGDQLGAQVIWLETSALASWSARLLETGWHVGSLPDDVRDRAEFFQAIASTFRLNPPLKSFRSWDALEDSLWQALLDLPDSRIAILWPNASRLRKSEPDQFAQADSLLRDIVRSLNDPAPTVGRPKTVAVLLGAEQDEQQ